MRRLLDGVAMLILRRSNRARTAASSPVHPAHWLISTQVSAQNARRLARLCLSYSNRWLEAFENTHRTCAESLTQKGDVNELEKQGGDVLAALNASRGQHVASLPSHFIDVALLR